MAVLAASAPPNPHSFKLGVSAYLDGLPAPVLGRLYEAPSSCLAIFRLLPPNARYIVLNLLWNDVGVSRTDLDLIARRSEGKRCVASISASTDRRRQMESSLAALARLHILGLAGPQQLLRVDPAFGQSLRYALTGGCAHSLLRPADGAAARGHRSARHATHLTTTRPPRPSSTTTPRSDGRCVAAHTAALTSQTILHFLVGSESSRRPGDSVLRLLEHSELMTRTGKRYDITARGFQFLLEEVNTQLWDLLLQYIGLAEREGKDPVDVLGFYFMLGSLTLGQDYAVEHLTDTQQACVDDLVALGLIYQSAVCSAAR